VLQCGGGRRGRVPEIVFSHFKGDEPGPHRCLIRPEGTGLRWLPWFNGTGDPLDWIQRP
jgi:hypothetical protein